MSLKEDGFQITPLKETIQVILGHPPLARLSNRLLKSHIRTLGQATPRVNQAYVNSLPKMVFKGATPISQPHNDPMVTKLIVVNYEIIRVLIDARSSIYVVLHGCFVKLRLHDKYMSLALFPNMDFIGHATYPKGMITLPTKVG